MNRFLNILEKVRTTRFVCWKNYKEKYKHVCQPLSLLRLENAAGCSRGPEDLSL